METGPLELLRSALLHIISWLILPSPTSFSLRLYCGEPARTPSRISFALLLVDAPHLILSAVVLRRACSRSLAHFLHLVNAPHLVLSAVVLQRACLRSSWSSRSLRSSLMLPSVDGSSLVLSVVILREPARAPP